MPAFEDRTVRGLVFWSALLSTVWAVLFDISIGLGAAGAPTRLLAVASSLLLALSFLVLVSSLHASAGVPLRTWTQLALSFATVYAALLSWNYYLQLTVVRTHPAQYAWLSMGFTSASAFWSLEVIGYTLLGLAAACLVPVFAHSRSGLVIRRSFLINAAATLLGGVGYAISGNPLHFTVLASLGVWAIAFPLGTALVAVASRSAEPFKGRPNIHVRYLERTLEK